MPYADPIINKKYHSEYGKKNKKRLSKYKLDWYHSTNRKKYVREWYQKNKEEIRRKNRDRVKKNRLKILEALGSKCAKCGNEDWRVLQVDHVNGNGNNDRKTRGHSASGLLQSIMKNKGMFQLLCANCNWIKRYEKGEQMLWWNGRRK